MNLIDNQLIEELSGCQNILLAGAGGGFDVYSSIPLYFALRKLNKRVHLANLSFSSLRDDASQITEHCFEVTRETKGSDTYFPERTLCRWLAESEGISQSVYSFPQSGVRPLQQSYTHLSERLNLDAIVLVDGGTDSLMRGDEFGLGTPTEDIVSMLAVSQTKVSKKLLSCIGFGVDRFHGVCHAQFLEAVAVLNEQNAFLGAFSLMSNTAEAKKFTQLVEYSSDKTPSRPSIVNTSIAAAIAGKFGNFHATQRTKGSKLWISPLMAMYWSFQLESVVQRNLYANRLLKTVELHEVTESIQEFRRSVPSRSWEVIPD